MKDSMVLIFGLLALQFFIICSSVMQEPAEPIAVENFIKNPTKSSFQLNPDGTRYGYLSAHSGHQGVFVVDLASGQSACVAHSSVSDIDDYLWADSRTLLYQLTSPEDSCDRIFRLCLNQGEPICLTEKSNMNFKLVHTLRMNPDRLLIAVSGAAERVWEPYWLDWRAGKIDRIAENSGNITEWLLDHKGQGIIAISEKGVDSHILYKATQKDPFIPLLTYNNVHDFFRPVCFTPDNRNIYAYSNIGRDKIALVEYDLSAHKEICVLFEVPDYDLFGDDEVDFVRYSPRENRLAYAFYTSWRRTYHFFDDHYREVVSKLENRFDNHVIRLVSTNQAENKHIVKISSDRLRGIYYLYEEGTGEIRMLENIFPWLNKESMAKKQPITFNSRDGYLIHGYLTLPKGVRPEGLPLVVLPHGGPRWRDSWEMGRFTEVQLFANRGYAVLNVNFRGSSGYGKKFLKAGFKQNGLNVQNDITDGIQYLINLGIADKERIAIMGGSYGGYVVLAGLAFTPDLYACGVDFFGVSNFLTFLESMPPWVNKEPLYQTIGHPERDKNLLIRTSPLFHVENIKVPVLVSQGGKDPIVNKAESEQIVAALRERNIDVQYIYKENEGHGYFRDEQNWLELWKAVDAFLAKHIGIE